MGMSWILVRFPRLASYERFCTDLKMEENQVSFPCIVKKNNTLLDFGTLQGNVI